MMTFDQQFELQSVSVDTPEINEETISLLQHQYNPITNVNSNYAQHKAVVPSILEKSKDDATTPEDLQRLKENPSIDIEEYDINWYYWEAIHYLSKRSEPKLLKVLVDGIGNKINNLTALSENALHVLLKYGKYNSDAKVILRNGNKMQTCQFLLKQHKDIFDCANILIQGDININHGDLWGNTPIALAINRRYYNVIRLLIRNKADLECLVENNLSAREILKKLNFTKLPNFFSFEKSKKELLFDYLRSRNEIEFVGFNNGNLSQYRDIFDEETMENSCCTLLQFCFRRGFLDCFASLGDDSTEQNIFSSKLLAIFCQKGYFKAIRHLIENGADVNFSIRKFQDSLISSAVERSYFPFLAVILYLDCEDNTENCLFLWRLAQNCLNDICGRGNVRKEMLTLKRNMEYSLMLLLSKIDTCVEKLSSQELQSTLNKAIANTGDETVRLVLKLDPPLIISEDNVKKMNLKLLEEHLDNCIEQSGCSDKEILLNCISLVGDIRITEVIEKTLTEDEFEHLITHPTFILLINLMWKEMRVFFYINLAYVFMYFVSLLLYIIDYFQDVNNFTPCKILFYALFALVSLLELFQLFSLKLQYVKSKQSIVKMFLISFSIALVTAQIKSVWMILTLLFATVELTLMLGRVPRFAKYTVVFQSVTYFFKFFAFYFLQFVTFAICFWILFADKNNWSKNEAFSMLFNNTFQSITRFTGELNIEKEELDKAPILGRVVFVVFILGMPIILNNIMVGVMVTDMDSIQRKAKLYELQMHAGYACRLEKMKLCSFSKIIKGKMGVKLDDINIGNKTKLRIKEMINSKNVSVEENLLKNVYRFIEKTAR